MHFAAFCYVGESVTDPLKYYLNNVGATLHLLKAMLAVEVRQFVFSSTCATYGVPDRLPMTEDLPQAPDQSVRPDQARRGERAEGARPRPRA